VGADERVSVTNLRDTGFCGHIAGLEVGSRSRASDKKESGYLSILA